MMKCGLKQRLEKAVRNNYNIGNVFGMQKLKLCLYDIEVWNDQLKIFLIIKMSGDLGFDPTQQVGSGCEPPRPWDPFYKRFLVVH